ncbi:MAG: RNA polymerase sigma factor [Kiritimatiellae bacterium]|nr:RNA polymerase sigma factor [Kiritimatiellia bacterium]
MTLARNFCVDESDAEELVNRTFAAVVEGIDDYLEQSAFFGWMCQILRNIHAKDIRRKEHGATVYPGDVPDFPDEGESDRVYRELDAMLLREAVAKLPPDQRELVVLHYFMDIPIGRIAKILTTPEGTVKRRLHYARKALGAKLGVAMKKPGGKALLVALALCGLTTLGAAVHNLANNGGTRDTGGETAIEGSAAAGDAETGETVGAGDGTGSTGETISSPASSSALSFLNLHPFTPSTIRIQEQNMNATAKTAAVLASALALQTAAPLVATGSTISLTTKDASGQSSFDKWDISGGGTNAPSAENDYVVAGNLHIRVIYNRTFGGNSITFGTGTASGTQGGLVVSRGDSSVSHSIGFGKNGAILQNGYFTTWESDRTPRIISAGPLTVTAPESNPFRIAAAEVDTRVTATSFNTNNAWSIEAPIKGDAGTALMLCAGGVRGSLVIPASTNSFTIRGSMAEFYGKLIVSGGLAGSAREAVPVNALFFKGGDVVGGSIVVENDATATFESLAVNGSVVVQSGAKVMMRYTDRTLTTAGLELQADSILLVNNKVGESKCGKIAVTESLTVEKGAIVRLETHPYSGSNFDPYDWVVLTLPANKGTIPLENFECPDVDGMPPCTLSTNLVDGVWQLVIHKDAHDVLKANDDNDTTISHALPSACTNATSWKSGNAPAPGKMYVAGNGVGGLSSTTYPVIRTPYYPKTATEFVFAGDTLALGDRSLVLPCSKDVTFPRLVLSANSTYVLSLASVPSYLRGTLYLRTSNDNSSQKIQAYMRGLNTVAAEVSGPGTLFVTGRNGSGNPYGDIEFTALNTNYTGRIKVYANVSSTAAGTVSYKHERVFVTDARNLGGALDEFRADALELADYSVLEARNDVDMNVANRGVKVTGNAGFAAPEDVTLAISNDITWNGTARKTGAGTLALGGAPLIASGANATLAVEEGFLSVRSTGAVDGVTVTFDNGAYLLVDPATTDANLASFGAVNLVANPFDGELPVAFNLPEGAGSNYVVRDIAVCTVANEETANALAVSAAANTRKMRGLRATYSTRTNGDGTVTVLASIAPQAFVIVLR